MNSQKVKNIIIKYISPLHNLILKQVQDDKNLSKFVILFFLIILFLTGCNTKTQPTLLLNGTKIIVELATTPSQQAQGLSGHAPLTDNQGMLFIFPEKSNREFWMKDMLFPIDIIWLNDDKIVKISKELKPEGASPQNIYSPGEPVNKVLEIKAGRADELKLKINDRVVYTNN